MDTDRLCQNCDLPIDRTRPYAIYCYKSCSNAGYYQRKKSSNDGLREICCKNCGKGFKQTKQTQFCCSKNCSSALWRRENMTAAQRRKYRLKHAYGISQEQWDSMLLEQFGRCKVCKRLLDDDIGLATDHCHQSGVVRGILCSECNLGLGHFKDSPELLRHAAEYLEEFYG